MKKKGGNKGESQVHEGAGKRGRMTAVRIFARLKWKARNKDFASIPTTSRICSARHLTTRPSLLNLRIRNYRRDRQNECKTFDDSTLEFGKRKCILLADHKDTRRADCLPMARLFANGAVCWGADGEIVGVVIEKRRSDNNSSCRHCTWKWLRHRRMGCQRQLWWFATGDKSFLSKAIESFCCQRRRVLAGSETVPLFIVQAPRDSLGIAPLAHV